MPPYKRIISGIKRIFESGADLRPATALHLRDAEERKAIVIPRDKHNISRQNISKNALKVLYKLKQAGYQAHIVGGGVRDLLLERHPKDFDVATNARPEEVRSLFRNCRLIGRRFRLAHILFGREVIEVATFRAHHAGNGDDSQHSRIENGRIVRDNVYGSFEEDAARRDFTVNALYYNIADFSVLDSHEGMADIKAGLIRLIGDPIQRYREDPVRMLRAVRFAAKLNFRIEKNTAAPIPDMAKLLADISPSRLYDETLKLFLSGHAEQSLKLLCEYGLFQVLFPECVPYLGNPDYMNFLNKALQNTDTRLNHAQPVTPAFLFAVLFWKPYLATVEALTGQLGSYESRQQAGYQIFRKSNNLMALPKRASLMARDIWHLQTRMEKHSGKQTLRILNHQYYRAAYDFMLLRTEIDDSLKEQAEWWDTLYRSDEDKRQDLIHKNRPKSRSSYHRRRKHPRKPRNQTADDNKT